MALLTIAGKTMAAEGTDYRQAEDHDQCCLLTMFLTSPVNVFIDLHSHSVPFLSLHTYHTAFTQVIIHCLSYSSSLIYSQPSQYSFRSYMCRYHVLISYMCRYYMCTYHVQISYMCRYHTCADITHVQISHMCRYHTCADITCVDITRVQISYICRYHTYADIIHMQICDRIREEVNSIVQ